MALSSLKRERCANVSGFIIPTAFSSVTDMTRQIPSWDNSASGGGIGDKRKLSRTRPQNPPANRAQVQNSVTTSFH